MNHFADPSTTEKYDRLGFVSEGVLLRLNIGNVAVTAAEHPWKGVVLLFQSFTERSMFQFDVSLPAKCTVEQIAGLIYVNIAHNSGIVQKPAKTTSKVSALTSSSDLRMQASSLL